MEQSEKRLLLFHQTFYQTAMSSITFKATILAFSDIKSQISKYNLAKHSGSLTLKLTMKDSWGLAKLRKLGFHVEQLAKELFVEKFL